MPSRIPLGALAGLLLTAAAAQAQSYGKEEAQKLLQQADRLRQTGELQKALAEYERLRQADVPPEEKNESALKAGEARVLLSRIENNNSQLLDAAVKDFQQTIKDGDPKQQARAYNNLATVHLARNEPAEALKCLDSFKWTLIAPEQRYILHYNKGRAHDNLGEKRAALGHYDKALQANAHFALASRHALELIASSDDPAILPEAHSLGVTLAKGGNPNQAKAVGLAVLERKKFARGRELGIAILLRAYAGTNRPPDRFLGEEKQDLAKLAESGYAAAAEEIRKAHRDGLEVDTRTLQFGQVPQFPWLSSPERDERVRQAFAALLNQVGNHYAAPLRGGKEGDLRQALARYLLACMIAMDAEAAQNTAWVLSAAQKQLDPAITENFIKVVFDEKNNLYARRDKTRADWENLLRFHLLLGSIFESQGKWGPETEPRTAIFQFTWALRAEEKIRELDPGRDYRAPGLHERLAAAYQRNGQHPKSFEHNLLAAEKYLARHELPRARAALDKAEQVPPAGIKPDQLVRFEGLRAKAPPVWSRPAALASLRFDRPTAVGGEARLLTVALDGPAPSAGASIRLECDSRLVTIGKESIWFEPGKSVATVRLLTSEVKKESQAEVKAIQGPNVQKVVLTLVPRPEAPKKPENVTARPALKDLTLAGAKVAGGKTVQGTITLSGAAPAGGTVVALVSRDPKTASVPARVTVKEGATSATFTVKTGQVKKAVTVVITASLDKEERTVKLAVGPP